MVKIGVFITAQSLFYCPNKETAMGIIVVSLPCTAYQCGSFIAFCSIHIKAQGNQPMQNGSS